MDITQKHLDQLSYKILGCAIEVHKELGPGLLESVYEKCFIHELFLKGLKNETQRIIGLNYKGIVLDIKLRIDVLVEDLIIVELKSVESILSLHQSVLLTYMKMLEKPKGIIINFNSTNIFKEGQITMVNNIYRKLPLE